MSAGAAVTECSASSRRRRDEEQDASSPASQQLWMPAAATQSTEVCVRTVLRHVRQGARKRQVSLTDCCVVSLCLSFFVCVCVCNTGIEEMHLQSINRLACTQKLTDNMWTPITVYVRLKRRKICQLYVGFECPGVSSLLVKYESYTVVFIARQHTDARMRNIDIAILSVCLSVRPSVCLSVCPWHAGIVWKRLNIMSVFSLYGSLFIPV